jgi:outer membrane protein assembly factor BamB
VTLEAPPVTPPAAGLDRLYIGLEGARVAALELATGRVSWTRTLAGRITGLAAADGQLIAGTTGNAVFSLDLASGRQRWRWRVGGDAAGRSASDGRHVYFAARDNVLRAVDLRSGNLRWTAELPSRPVGGPQVFGDSVLVPLSTTVALFGAVAGEARGRLEASGEISASPYLRHEARPTAATLIAITRDGRMQGFGRRFEDPPAPLGPLPGQTVVP